MFNAHRPQMFAAYNKARDYFIRNWGELVEIEKYTHSLIKQVVLENLAEIRRDYDEASFLHPFWQNYPPEERGRSPRGDQFPWIEVITMNPPGIKTSAWHSITSRNISCQS